MGSNKNLLRTASVTGAAVAAAALPVTADAADVPDIPASDYGYFLSLEGGALFADPSFDKVGFAGSAGSGATFDLSNFDDELGFRGVAAFGQHFQNGWDWRVGVSVSRFMNNDASAFFSSGSSAGSGSSFEGDAHSDIDYETADLEIGFRPDSGSSFGLRLFFGLRFLHSEDSLKTNNFFSSGGFFSGGSIDLSTNTSTEFMGIGPRVGLDFASRMDDGVLGFSGMVAGAAIFGRRDEDSAFNLEVCSGGIISGGCFSSGGSNSDDENETIMNLEAALGLDLHLSDTSKITVGYRGEYWKDINGSADKFGGDPFNGDEDLFAHGPFVKFLAEF
jgi:hypothetical protein